MSRQFPESDWKVFRQLHAIALERYFEAAVEEASRTLEEESVPARERFRLVLNQLKKQDRELSAVFDDLRRSTAFIQLYQIVSRRLLTDEELAPLTPETREVVRSLLDPDRG